VGILTSAGREGRQGIVAIYENSTGGRVRERGFCDLQKDTPKEPEAGTTAVIRIR
jgi:hypothetical protein